MSDSAFASPPEPPYYAVIFTSRRTAGENDYGAASDAMGELAARQPGYLGIESVRGADGFGITISYWESEDAIAHWRRNAEHAATRERGRNLWYEHYEVRVARVERAYAGPPARGTTTQ